MMVMLYGQWLEWEEEDMCNCKNCELHKRIEEIQYCLIRAKADLSLMDTASCEIEIKKAIELAFMKDEGREGE